MKAYVLNGINQLEYKDVPLPELKEGEVIVEVKAVGICGSDIPRIYETGTYHFPTIPGHEFAGVVHSVFDSELRGWIGKRVGVFPLIPCKKCTSCCNKQYEMCINYDYLGSRSDGGFAEYVAVPVWNLIELPDCVSYEEAAMLEPASVGIHALRQVNMSKVQSAAVFGTGTIGVLMAQWLRILGVKNIYLVGTNNAQGELLSGLEFFAFCNRNVTDAEQYIREFTGGMGVDLAIDCAGDSDVVAECLNVVRRGGEILVVGNPHDDLHLSKEVYWKLLRKQVRMCGTWNSSFTPDESEDDWRVTLAKMVEGQLNLRCQITHKLPFDKLQDGLELMRTKKEFYNKVMIVR